LVVVREVLGNGHGSGRDVETGSDTEVAAVAPDG